jgi:hypothetical protein
MTRKPPPFQFGLGALFRLTVATSLLLVAITAEMWLVAMATLVIGLGTLLWIASLFKPPTHS